jgi:O-succinylbenzoic acid--CoA ligase
VGGLSILMRSALFATGVVAQDPFDAVAANHLIETEAVTLTSVVTVMLRRMLDARGPKPYPPSLRAVLVGGGPVPPAIIEEAWSRGLPALPTYGLTETSAQAVTATRGEARQHPSLAGRPLLFTEVAILDPSGSSLPPGQEGEIAVRGPAVFHGYFRRPDLTAAVLRDGWLLTGDVGRLDEEGRLTVLDRRSDLIVSGGENVYPAEVEAALRQHPAISDAAVVGVADRRWGEVGMAFVQPRRGATLTEQEVIAHCRQHLAGFKVPRQVVMLEELPQLASGKVDKRRLAVVASARRASGGHGIGAEEKAW